MHNHNTSTSQGPWSNFSQGGASISGGCRLESNIIKIDGVGPVDNRPATTTPLSIFFVIFSSSFNTKHSKNCKTLPWEHHIGCQCVKLFILKYVATLNITTVTITIVTITTVTITTVNITTVTITIYITITKSQKNVTKFLSQNFCHKIIVTKS